MASVPTGEAGYIEIVDDGSAVHFYVGGGYSSTNFGSASWSGTVNGVGVGGSFGYPAGAGRVWIASYSVSTSQTVSFGIGDTETSGMGGPTSMSLYVNRATVPPAPRVIGPDVGLDQITQTSIRFRFAYTGDGGSGILRWEYQAWGDPSFAGSGTGLSSGTTIVNWLTPNQLVYFRARGVNAVGAGPWSSVLSARTLAQGFQGGKAGAFVPFPTTVGKGSSFVDVPIFIGKGGAFVPLG